MAKWTCKHCDGERVEIDSYTLAELRTTIHPSFRTLSSKSRDGWWRMCPRCDAYALGMELETGFPLRTPQGCMTTIHDIQTEGNG